MTAVETARARVGVLGRRRSRERGRANRRNARRDDAGDRRCQAGKERPLLPEALRRPEAAGHFDRAEHEYAIHQRCDHEHRKQPEPRRQRVGLGRHRHGLRCNGEQHQPARPRPGSAGQSWTGCRGKQQQHEDDHPERDRQPARWALDARPESAELGRGEAAHQVGETAGDTGGSAPGRGRVGEEAEHEVEVVRVDQQQLDQRRQPGQQQRPAGEQPSSSVPGARATRSG